MNAPFPTAESIAEFAFAQFLISTPEAEPWMEGAIAHQERLCEVICQQFCGHIKAERAIAAIKQGSRGELTKLVVYLQDEIEDNSDFARIIQALAHPIRLAKQNCDRPIEQSISNDGKGYQTRIEGGKAYISDDLYITDNSRMSHYNAGSTVGSQSETVRGNVYNFFGTLPPVSLQVSHPSSNGSKPSPPHNIPRTDVYFVDRKPEVEKLHQLLQHHDLIVITNGADVEGVGKTELAIQYCHKHLTDYPGGVCWLYPRQAVIGIQLVGFVSGCFTQVQIPDTLSLTDKLARCWQGWQAGQVLLVIDDVTDYEQIKPYLPSDSRFKLLITAFGTTKFPIPRSQFSPLPGLPPDAALELLKALLGEEMVSQETSFAEKLCAYVGYSPLALHTVAQCRKPEGVYAS
jgi:hypothetical protein